MLAVRDLVKVYPGPVTALSGVSFEVERGMLGLLGPNGAGKSTLMRIVAGLLEPTSGRVELDGVDVTAELRSPAVSAAASRIAVFPEVRRALLARQREFRRHPGLVADGRDMGTVVFPDASVKVYVTATPEERARRRYKQLIEKGNPVTIDGLLRDIRERDARDSARPAAPLKTAADASVLDTTGLSIDDSVAFVLERFRASRA